VFLVPKTKALKAIKLMSLRKTYKYMQTLKKEKEKDNLKKVVMENIIVMAIAIIWFIGILLIAAP